MTKAWNSNNEIWHYCPVCQHRTPVKLNTSVALIPTITSQEKIIEQAKKAVIRNISAQMGSEEMLNL